MNRLFDGKIHCFGQVDSTNDRLKAMAEEGAPEGTVVIAEEQTAGRGTGQRTFYSPKGEGIYLSVLLRPQVGLADLMTLTGRTAAAVCRGIEKASGAPCRIKWLNDIYLNGRKLCGILTELSEVKNGGVDYVVIGIGLNVSQTAQNFARQGLGDIATSLEEEGYQADREKLIGGILEQLEEMYRLFPGGKEEALDYYRSRCMTIGRQVGYLRDGGQRDGLALGVDENFALMVDESSGRHTIFSGTVALK